MRTSVPARRGYIKCLVAVWSSMNFSRRYLPNSPRETKTGRQHEKIFIHVTYPRPRRYFYHFHVLPLLRWCNYSNCALYYCVRFEFRLQPTCNGRFSQSRLGNILLFCCWLFMGYVICEGVKHYVCRGDFPSLHSLRLFARRTVH